MLIMVMMLAIVISTVNVLQVSPLFFLGSTLIFIGYDLCYEWVRNGMRSAILLGLLLFYYVTR